MSVKELIEELQKMPQDAELEVVIAAGWENVSTEICSVTLREDGYVELV